MDTNKFKEALLESIKPKTEQTPLTEGCHKKKNISEGCHKKKGLKEGALSIDDANSVREKIEELSSDDFVYFLNEANIVQPIYRNDRSFFEMFDTKERLAKQIYLGTKFSNYDYDAEWVTYDDKSRLTTAIIKNIFSETIDELVEKTLKSERLNELLYSLS